MTKKEAIESIKNATKAISMLFGSEERFEAVKVKDGSQDVSIEGEYAKGTKVSVSSSTGSIAAPDGNYTLSNGKKFSTKGGLISEVMDDDTDNSDEDFSKETESPEAKVEDKGEAKVENEVKLESEVKVENETKTEDSPIVTELTEKVKELEEAFNKIKEAFATKDDLKSLGENFNSIQKAFEVLSDTPAEFTKVDGSVLAKEEKSKKLEALAGLMKK